MSKDITKADSVLQEAWPKIKAEYEKKYPSRHLFIISVDRPPSEQLALFCKGRLSDKPGPIVTYKDGYNNLSHHNADPSQALDFGILSGGLVMWQEDYFKDIGNIIFLLGYSGELTWGGDFKNLKDYGHIEVK